MTAKSISIQLKPLDKRCRYWAKIIRAGQPLPAPSEVVGAADLPQSFVPVRQGGPAVDEEMFPGDFLIQGEERKHNAARGWQYWITWMDPDGHRRTVEPDSSTKAALKAQGLEPRLLAGAGGIAACVRVAHGLRAGLEVNGWRLIPAVGHELVEGEQ